MSKIPAAARPLNLKMLKADYSDCQAIAALIAPSITEFISVDFAPKAARAFAATVSPAAIAGNMQRGFDYWLAWAATPARNSLVGVIGMSKPSHLFHLFVDKKFHRQGVGRFMWRYIVDNSQEKQFTVSSSTFAVAFYQKIGFVKTAEAQEKNGIISVPMSFTR